MRSERVTRQPTITRANTSMTNTTENHCLLNGCARVSADDPTLDHAATAFARTASKLCISSSSSVSVNNPSGPRGVRSVNGDS